MAQQREQWVVQETKLIPPVRHGGLIERQRVLRRAMTGAQGRLLLVVGPAGFGKTSTLSRLHRELSPQARCVGWISLDEADNDHARFLSHFVEAFRRHEARFGAVISTLLGSGAPLPASVLRTSLLNELAGFDNEIFLFLDDYHLVSNPEVRETVNALLTAPLDGVHLLIASRSRNELPVSRLRSRGQLIEIGSADLAFTAEETQHFLASACSRTLEPAHIALLHERTEGWAASLQLACIALDSGGDIQQFLTRFSGETQGIGDFLVDEVLRRQSPGLQEFLMAASILERFDAALANAVTDRTDARGLIDEIEAKNLFVYSLDDRRSWYRFHHLFADFLRRRLRDHAPDRVAALHRRAADCLSARGFNAEAIEHAFLAGDTAWAGRLLDDTCVHLFATGQIETLHRHAAQLPAATLRQLPRLQLELSWDYEIAWRFSDARTILGNVRQTLHQKSGEVASMSASDRAFLESKLLHREMMLELFTDRQPSAMTLCRQWQDQMSVNDPFMRASVGTAMMLIEREHYRCEGTAPRADALRALFLEGGAIYGTVFHDSVAATTLFMRGDVEAACATLLRARSVARDLAGERSPVIAMPTALLAEICYEQGELVQARDLLSEHASFSAEFGFLDQAIARFVTASRLAFADGRQDDAEAALDAGFFIADQHGLPRLQAHLTSERARQLIAAGRINEVAMLLDRPGLAPWLASPSPGSDATTTHELFALAWARATIARGDPARAVPVLRRWVAFTRQQRCLRATLRTSAVLAHAHARAADPNAAQRTLREALALIPNGGFVRTFVDEGPAMAALLENLHAGLPDSEENLRRVVLGILHRFDHTPLRRPAASHAPAADDEAQERLSEREIEILRLSAEGMATSDISRATGLTENTVKWYWQRIFAKLGVHRRFDAVKLARKRHWWMA